MTSTHPSPDDAPASIASAQSDAQEAVAAPEERAAAPPDAAPPEQSAPEDAPTPDAPVADAAPDAETALEDAPPAEDAPASDAAAAPDAEATPVSDDAPATEVAPATDAAPDDQPAAEAAPDDAPAAEVAPAADDAPSPAAEIAPATDVAPPTADDDLGMLDLDDLDDFDDDLDDIDGEDRDSSGMPDMGELLDSMDPIKPLRRGEVVEGVVMRIDGDGILVNIGHKSEGVVQQREMRSLSPEEMQAVSIGDKVVTYVIRPESADNAAVLSIDRALGETGWRELEKSLESNETVEGQILGFNKGGSIVDVQKVQGFVPMSQLVSVSREIFRAPPDGEQEAPEVTARRGQLIADATGRMIPLKILEINRSRNRAIFSERQAVQEWRDAQKARLVQELQVGDIRQGEVTGISSFGAFVDLGGADGLVHISEMSWGPVSKPDDVVSIGDKLNVYVLRVDVENRKIALSLRRLEPEPWETIHERLRVDDIVDAQITKLTNFGAFARVEGNIEGLVHISELSDRVIGHPREVVQEGDEVRLKVLRIEPERRRLGLSLKQTQPVNEQFMELQ